MQLLPFKEVFIFSNCSHFFLKGVVTQERKHMHILVQRCEDVIFDNFSLLLQPMGQNL